MPSWSPPAAETPVYDLSSDSESAILSTTPATIENDPSEANSELNSGRNKKRTRGAILTDIWAAAREPKEGEELRDKHGHRWFYCSICKWKGAASDRIRTHLRSHNIRIDDAQPPVKKRAIERAIAGLPGFFDRQKANQEGRDLTEEKYLGNAINKPAFLEALVQLISKHSLPLSIVEWPEFYALIASVNYVAANVVKTSRNNVPDLLKSSFLMHKDQIKKRLQESLTWIHFSTDMWTSPGKTGVLGVVAHFISKTRRKVEKALLALRELPGTHSGEAQAEHVLQVINEYNLVEKIGFFTLDNHGANDTMLRAVARSISRLDPTRCRIRCNGHIINLVVQAFLFGKDKEATEEAIRQIGELSKQEQKGSKERLQTAAEWRKLGPLGKLHNLVIWIHSSTRLYQAWIRLTGRMIPRDNDTRWNSWWLMIHVALELRKEMNNFVQDHWLEDEIKEDYLDPNDWQELIELHDFLQPFWEITQGTQFDISSLDQALSAMDFLHLHFTSQSALYKDRGDLAMENRLITSWFKFGEYYKMTEESPAYAAAILLHPSLRKACLQNSDSWKKADINKAIREVRKLWKDHFKPATEQRSTQDKLETPYDRWKRERYLNIGVSSTIGDDFERFITVWLLNLFVMVKLIGSTGDALFYR